MSNVGRTKMKIGLWINALAGDGACGREREVETIFGVNVVIGRFNAAFKSLAMHSFRFSCCSLLWVATCSAGTAQTIEPTIFRAEVVFGKQEPVCESYARALSQTAFLEVPSCGRWALARTADFSRVESRSLTELEFEREFPLVRGFIHPDALLPRNRAGLTADLERRSKEYRTWSGRYASVDPRLGQYALMGPSPAQWIFGVDVGGADRLLLWSDNAADCGKEFSTSGSSNGVTRLQNHFLIVTSDGRINEEKTRRVFLTEPNAEHLSETKASAPAQMSRDSLGLFRFRGTMFVDAFYKEDAIPRGLPKSDPRLKDTLAVFRFSSSLQPLRLECEIAMAPRNKPWKFAD